ncbi:MAG: cytochrome c oxidase subunit 4 [Brachybacterium sp.]|nr:cytochrome c oxidase subunit 4 [Brachybacterium sp.]
MGASARIFGIICLFLVIVGVVYGFLSYWFNPTGHLEFVGAAGLPLAGGMSLMIALVLWMNARRHKGRPEDMDDANVDADSGIQGSFAPYSWWPLWASIAAALAFLGVAAGWWITALGIVMGIWAVTGWVMEFSKGVHAH